MAPSDKEFDFLADRLAEDISTMEKQLEELGAEVFSSAQLIEMRGRFQERLENFEFFQKKLVRLAILSPFLILVAVFFLWLGIQKLGMLALMAFPVSLMLCLFGIFLIYQNFGSRGRMENWLEMVEEELKNRKRG